MRKDSVDAQPVAILASGFSRRHTLLVVQTDAWERYGERATRCFEFGVGRADSRVENAVRAAAPTTFEAVTQPRRSQFYTFISCRSNNRAAEPVCH